MKKIIVLACFMLFAVNAIAEERTLDGFWGIKFGTSKVEGKKIMASKGLKLDTSRSSKDILIYYDVKFGGRDAVAVGLKYDKNRFYDAKVFYRTPLDAKTLELYENVKADINTKYYTTNLDDKSFKYPYSEGDGHEITAIKLGLAHISALWQFERSDGEKNLIVLEIKENLMIFINYIDGKISDEVVIRNRSTDSKDY